MLDPANRASTFSTILEPGTVESLINPDYLNRYTLVIRQNNLAQFKFNNSHLKANITAIQKQTKGQLFHDCQWI